MNKKYKAFSFLSIIIIVLTVIAVKVIEVDPFFQYHKPKTDTYYYRLEANNQRNLNYGIAKTFDYDGVITGSSMAENFKTSEAEKIFGGNFIKITYSGGTYNEINKSLEFAKKHNKSLKTVIESLDLAHFFDDKDGMRTDLGTYPTYLYDENIINDIDYIFNQEVIIDYVYPMITAQNKSDFSSGITSFDTYSNWMAFNHFGNKILYPNGRVPIKNNSIEPVLLTQIEIDKLKANIQQNVTSLAKNNPDMTFYIFFPPYSAAWWQNVFFEGKLDRQIKAEKIVIEEILQCNNIKLFSYSTFFNITTDLNNYKDYVHYGEWINSLILRYMHNGIGQLTYDNYEQYLDDEYKFYSNYDYSKLVNQEDYENDFFAEALMNFEITGIEPMQIDLLKDTSFELSHAVIEEDVKDGDPGVVCTGMLYRPWDTEVTIDEYLWRDDYVGIKIPIQDIASYKYLEFYGKKQEDHGELVAFIYDSDGKVLASCAKPYQKLDSEWHQYLIPLNNVDGEITIILNGGYSDWTGSPDSKFLFSNITLY